MIKILTLPNPILHQKAKKISKIDSVVLSTIGDLILALQSLKNPHGVGLATVQIGKPLSVFICKIGKNYVPFLNPEIKKFSSRLIESFEGCLSVPGYYGPVKRSLQIELSFLNKGGQKKVKTYRGFLARVIQHEVDHLNGILFVDRIALQGGKLYKVVGKDET